MQVVIPMSGFGERFRRVGYSVPKPLIEIDGKPIIAHVIDMFPGETDFVFVCNNEHLQNPEYKMEEILKHYCPSGKVLGIESHKLGPINAVLKVQEVIDPASPVVVNYCDFTCYWDWSHFKQFVKANDCDGAVPAYKGFHPHTLGTTNYAYIQETGGWVTAIQEKQPYTDDRMQEYASSGTYYFKSGQLMLDVFRQVMAEDINVGGEYYASLAYIPLLSQGKKIAVYGLQHFMQWGTPGDVDEYNNWSAAFRRLMQPKDPQKAVGSVVVPMAGMGKRFSDEGYVETKPLIKVSGQAMVKQACDDLPLAADYTFVLRKDMPGYQKVSESLQATYPACTIVELDSVTEGQAITAQLGVEQVEGGGPITIGACDFGMLYAAAKFNALIDSGVDLIVWSVRGNVNAGRNPQMFGWIDVDEDNNIRGISVKTPLNNPQNDPIVLGTFSFANKKVFTDCVDRLVARDGKINGEYYLDSCVEDALALGYKCKIFEVDYYLSWGTPNDLKTFEYWQSCFSKWSGHPYQLEADSRVPKSELEALKDRYKATKPAQL